MYLAAYEFGGEPIRQGVIEIRLLDGRETRSDWRELFQDGIRRLLDLPVISFSLRLRLGEDRSLRYLLMALFRAELQDDFLQVRGALGRLDEMEADSCFVPATQAEHEALLADFPEYHCPVNLKPLSHGATWFSFTFRVHAMLDRLLCQAASMELELGYQLNITPHGPDRQTLRAACLNLAGMRELPGCPAALLTHQEEQVEALGNASALMEEYLATGGPESAKWCADLIKHEFRAQTARLGIQQKIEPPDFQFQEQSYTEALNGGAHRILYDEMTVSEICNEALDLSSFRLWLPPEELRRLYQHRQLRLEEVLRAFPECPRPPMPYEGPGEYFFISYRRMDMPSISAHMHTLRRHGGNLWYDQGTPGGAEWDVFLSDRIRGCRLLVVFLSKLAVESKWVVREIRFADACCKPILPISLEQVKLPPGLDMILGPVQTLDATAADFPKQLARAIRGFV